MRPRTASFAAVLGLVVAFNLVVTPSSAVSLPSSASPKVVATKAGSCKGFSNRIGMTNKLIRIGNVADLSGPVPGLHVSAQQATKAYVAYFNSARSICGRKLQLKAYDSRTDAGGNNRAYAAQCKDTFASVGSMSVFDAGGAKVAQDCRLPDLRVTSTSVARNACTTCFGIEARGTNEAAHSVPDYFVAKHPVAAQKAAFLYLNVGSLPAEASTQIKVAEKRGYQVIHRQAIDVADFNYGPYVAQLKTKGIEILHFLGAYQQTARLAQAMQSAGFTPTAFVVDRGAYRPEYAALGGTAVDRSIVAINTEPLNSNQAELKLYRAWLERTTPGATPTTTGLYAWSAAKLFTTQAASLGAKLTRSSLNARLRTVTAWTAGGLHVPQQVGNKRMSPCTRLLLLQGGRWISIGGTAYRCTGVTRAS